jgi:hypothetical protein
MRFPQRTTRQLIIAVAAVGVALGGAIWAEEYRRVYVRQKVADRWAQTERYWSIRAKADAENPVFIRENPTLAKERAEGYRRFAKYTAALQQIYLRAAARPWEPVPPLPSLRDF